VRPQLEVEEFECRLVPSVSVFIQNHNLTVQADDGFNAVTVNHAQFPSGGVTFISDYNQFGHVSDQTFSDSSFDAIQIFGGKGGLVTNIRATQYEVDVFDIAYGDVVNVGNSNNSVQDVKGDVFVENEPSYTTININDQGDTLSRSVYLGPTTPERVNDTPLGYVLFRDGQGNWVGHMIVYDSADTLALNLNLSAQTSNVRVTATFAPTTIFNNAAATVHVGNSTDGLGDIQRALTLENEPSYDTIILDDVHDTASQTATVSTVARSGDSSLGQLTGLSNAPISWDLADTMSVDLYTNGQTSVSDPGNLVTVH
jgi:hypothetical protein